MESPLLTIGLPAFNAEETISEAIKSILAQTYTNFELLIADDGSTDDTLDIIRSFHDARIKVVADGKNLGIAARLNKMVRMAQGEIFVRMDADDIMMPMRLEKQLAFLQQHPEADVIGCNALVIDEKGKVIGTRDVAKKGAEFTRETRLIHPTLMGHTEWFRQHPYKEEYSGIEDYELWLRVKDEATLLRMSEPLLYYRERMTYDVHRYLRERIIGIKMIWVERYLFSSTARAIAQIGYNIGVMIAVPVVHLLHLDKWVIGRRNGSMV